MNLFTDLGNVALKPQKTEEENLSTVVLAYLLNTSPKLKERFLIDLLKGHKNPRWKQFQDAVVETQKRMGNSIFDIWIPSKSKSNNIIIENKIHAGEGSSRIDGENVGQVQKYLNTRKGYVVFLAPRDAADPKIKRTTDRYLGHFPWEDVCRIIQKVFKKERSQIAEEFLNYMEEKGMANFKPFKQCEIRSAAAGYAFASKAKLLLEKVRRRVEPNLQKTLGVRNLPWKEHIWSNDSSSGESLWTRIPDWDKSTLWVSIDVFVEKPSAPQFSVSIGVWKRWRRDILEDDSMICSTVEKLKKRG